MLEVVLWLGKSPYMTWLIQARQDGFVCPQTTLNNPREVDWRDRTDGSLGPPGDSTVFIKQSLLDNRVAFAKLNRIAKVEVAAGLDQSEKHPVMVGVRNDLADPSNGEVTSRTRHLAWFQINDPVTFALFGTAKVLFGELILGRRNIVVSGVGAVHEYSESHRLFLTPPHTFSENSWAMRTVNGC